MDKKETIVKKNRIIIILSIVIVLLFIIAFIYMLKDVSTSKTEKYLRMKTIEIMGNNIPVEGDNTYYLVEVNNLVFSNGSDGECVYPYKITTYDENDPDVYWKGVVFFPEGENTASLDVTIKYKGKERRYSIVVDSKTPIKYESNCISG